MDVIYQTKPSRVHNNTFPFIYARRVTMDSQEREDHQEIKDQL